MLDLEVLEELGECDKIGEPKTLEMKAEDLGVQSTTIASNGFYGNRPPGKTQPQSLPARSNAPTSGSHATIYPIEALSPYAHKWTIKARCTHKSEIKTWHNKNGEGKLFSVNLLDESGEIRGTGFKEQCDALYDIFQEGGVYYISAPCRVQLAKKQFTNLSNDYELTFENATLVEKVFENTFLMLLFFKLIENLGGRAKRCSPGSFQLHKYRRPTERGERCHYRRNWRFKGGIGN